MNSNGMDVVLQPTSASWRITGGVLDLYLLAGPSPLAVLEQLTAIIGRPMMVPAWSLGLMNSKCDQRWLRCSITSLQVVICVAFQQDCVATGMATHQLHSLPWSAMAMQMPAFPCTGPLCNLQLSNQ